MSDYVSTFYISEFKPQPDRYHSHFCRLEGYCECGQQSDKDDLSQDYANNKKRSHTQLDSRKQVIAFQDRVITINIKEAQHLLKREKQVIDKSSIMLKISTKSMHRVLV